MQEQSFLTDLANQFGSSESSIVDFFINILITIVLAYIMGLIYSKYGNSLSNRKKLMQTFVLIAVTVMLVISIVKSSLALSLGLVGALSIVRFRTAIKEPEELVYFFVAIALGLGMGANQRLVTLVGAVVIILYIVIQNMNAVKSAVQQNLILSITNTTKSDLDENKILDLLKKHCSKIDLRRLDETGDTTELTLNVEFDNFENIINAKNELKSLGNIQFSFLENY
ncbi:MAG: DUF4956 domain-containing protein [Bacteroidia bacterium]|nr:DUF4956 domain-containing protein [Bacteroidia bacterium]NND25718.1 DUF4956 domain-containing protein [Flavobacteriaceae bacterium]MBT8279216.1 DUF4956 domain-containing protein [Bacteroidia bacterium]NNK59752.1 DUF4956 domain-containing protein [Flavobacteriaceae bacterium]NNL32016.1 DUF4956 domain-containing protein [Flavobacteriaceae bacterium]